jgi:predicted nucleic acid-binding protein
MIVDASLVIDAVADPGPRGVAARAALAVQPAAEPLIAPGHFTVEVMSGLRAAANRPHHPLNESGLSRALRDVESLGIALEATPWPDVHRASMLAQASLHYADAVYVAAAERHRTALLTTDGRIGRSNAPMRCQIITVGAGGSPDIPCPRP